MALFVQTHFQEQLEQLLDPKSMMQKLLLAIVEGKGDPPQSTFLSKPLIFAVQINVVIA
jgi:hypothetical protein